MKKKYNKLSVGKGLITALEQAVEYEKGKKVKGVKSKKINVAPIIIYRGSKIRKIRNKLGLSQTIFAHILGVSTKTVEAWESGRNEPQGPAQRILYLLEKDNKFLEKYDLIST